MIGYHATEQSSLRMKMDGLEWLQVSYCGEESEFPMPIGTQMHMGVSPLLKDAEIMYLGNTLLQVRKTLGLYEYFSKKNASPLPSKG